MRRCVVRAFLILNSERCGFTWVTRHTLSFREVTHLVQVLTKLARFVEPSRRRLLPDVLSSGSIISSKACGSSFSKASQLSPSLGCSISCLCERGLSLALLWRLVMFIGLSLIQEGLKLLQQDEEQADLVLCGHLLESLIGLELLNVQVYILILRNNVRSRILQDLIQILREEECAVLELAPLLRNLGNHQAMLIFEALEVAQCTPELQVDLVNAPLEEAGQF